LLGIGAILIVLALLWRRVATSERAAFDAVRLAEETQRRERFVRAVGQLADERLEVRLGAIYALEQVAAESTAQLQPAIEVLCAYVREHAAWQADTPPPSRLATDIQAVLTVLGRRPAPSADVAPVRLDLRRTDLRKQYAQLRFSPRPRRNTVVRRYVAVGQYTYIQDSAGRLSSRLVDGAFDVEFQSSDRFTAGVLDNYELLLRPLTVAGLRIPTGGYRFTAGRVGYALGQQRPVSGAVLFERGDFYGGQRTALTLSRSRLNLSSAVSLEPSLTLNWLDLPARRVRSTLAGSRITYTMTPLMFASALVQYNSVTRIVSVNARLRWEYRLGSELFVVYNDERDRGAALGLPALQNRALIVKVNRFLRF